jgi:hypothetical protein
VKSEEMARGEAQSLVAALDGVTDPDEFKRIAEEAGIETSETSTNRWGFMTFGQELMDEVFEAEPPRVIGPVARDDVFYVALVTEITPFDEEDFEQKKADIRNRLMMSWMQGQPVFIPGRPIGAGFTQLLEAQISYLVISTEVRIDRELLSSWFGGATESQ